MGKKYARKRKRSMDEATRKLLGARMMELIVSSSEGHDDLERRRKAEVTLNIAPREPKQKLRLRKDGKFGRKPGSKALDVLTGEWVVSEELIDVMRPLAYAKDGVPDDLHSIEIMLLGRSFSEFQAEVDAFKKKLRPLIRPLLESAAKTRQPSYAFQLLAEALGSVLSGYAQDDLKLPESWGPVPESGPGARIIDIEEKVNHELRHRKRRKRKAKRR